MTCHFHDQFRDVGFQSVLLAISIGSYINPIPLGNRNTIFGRIVLRSRMSCRLSRMSFLIAPVIRFNSIAFWRMIWVFVS